jgi:hypothetical protein
MSSSSTEFESRSGPLTGRVILLLSAYAPVVGLVGIRGWPDPVAVVALAAGLAGTALWFAFLLWLPRRQPRSIELRDPEPIDAEVTGYIVSLLLPVVAAANPSTGDCTGNASR